MAVRLYIGGTEGNKDGTLVSNGDMSNPIVFDGYDIESGDVRYAQFAKAYLRADEGEEWVGVCLKIADVSGSEDLHDIFVIGLDSIDSVGTGQLNKVIYPNFPNFLLEESLDIIYRNSSVNNYDGAYALFFPIVTDTNSNNACLYLSPLLYLGLKDPQTSIKIIMTGGAKNE